MLIQLNKSTDMPVATGVERYVCDTGQLLNRKLILAYDRNQSVIPSLETPLS